MRSVLFLSLLLGSTSVAAETRVVRQVVGDPVSATAAARAQSRTIYLNRMGVTVTPGANDARINRSSIVSQQSSIPAWQVSPELWSETMTCLRTIYAPFAVELTDVDPGSAPHIEAVFGGNATMLGLAQRAGGVAPFSVGCNVVENSIVFAFTDDLPHSAKVICEVMAQEIAHSYGLDHELLAADPTTYLSYAGARSFQDVDAACGESTARPCGAPGYPSCRATQNSYALLMERLGEAGAPDDEVTTPDDDEGGDGDGGDDLADDDAINDAALGCSTGSGQGWLVGLVLVVVARRARRFRR